MGADMILAAVPAAELTEARKQELAQLIEGLPEDEAPDWFDNADDWRGALNDAVEEYAECQGRRACTSLRLPGWECCYYFTGGMSWGDEPTDLMHSFDLICECNSLWNLLHEWALEDERRRLAEHALAVVRHAN